MNFIRKVVRHLGLLATVLILSIACSAEDGQDGINGLDGAMGEQGIPGQDGEDGADGEDGNANVIASDWIAVEFPSNPTTLFMYRVVDSNITQEVADSGLVYAFAKQTINGNSISLPFTFQNEHYYFGIVSSTSEFQYSGTAIDGFTGESFNVFSFFRYVIVPTSTVASKNINTANLDKMTYHEMMDYFGITP